MKMTEKEIEKMIDKMVNETVIKLKMAGLMKDNRKTATEKLEELLRNFPTFKAVSDRREETAKLVTQVEQALATIKNDPYYECIEMFYFENQTRDAIAAYFRTTPTTISRNKTRLLKELTPRLFSSDVIFEIFL